MLAESCYICLLRGWEIGEEVTTISCECASWAHEACLAKSVFKTGGCPTCKRSIFLIDDKIVLARAVADGDTGKVGLLLENGIQHSPRDLFDTTPLLQAARGGEERRGIPKRYGRGLHSTRRTKTRQVPGFEFDVRSRVWAWLLSTFSPVVNRMPISCDWCWLTCIWWVVRLPDDVDLPIHKRRAFQEARKSTNMDGERATLARLGWPTQQL
jgi:hypothetical protein